MYLVVTNQAEYRGAVVQVNGEVDVHTAPKLRAHLFELIEDGRHHLIVDMDHVTFFDSTGLGVLIGALKRVRKHRGSVRVVCSRERIIAIFRVTGLTEILPVHAGLEDAVAHSRAEPFANVSKVPSRPAYRG